jgi:hypothetical protein
MPFHHGLIGGVIANQRAYPVLARTAYDEDRDGASLVLTLDPAPANGVLLVACGISTDYEYTPPAGWTTITTNRIWYKIASGEGTTFTFTENGSKGDQGGPVVMAEITGVAASPIEDTDNATATATTPAGTTLGPKRLAIALATGTNVVSSMTNGWTISVNRNYDSKTAAIGYKQIAATGSTGTSDWSASCGNLTTLVIK